MKTSNYLLIVCLLAIAAATTLAGFMRASERRAERQPMLSLISTDKRDVWAEDASDTPPLAPGAALRIARRVALRAPLPDDTDEWVLDSIALHRMSFSGGADEWVYLAGFKPAVRPHAAPEAVAARLQIPVRFDGTVPPGIVKLIP